MRFRSTAFIFGLVLLVTGQAYGQDLIFDPDDVEEIDSTEFFTDEDPEEFGSTGSLPVVTGLIIPGDVLDSRTAELLTDQLMEELDLIPVAEAVPNFELKDEFEIMGSELATECAFDPVCLGRVGWDIGLDQVVIGRATSGREGSQVSFTLDLVDLESRSVLRYRSVEVDNNMAMFAQVISTQLPFLFEIREGPDDVVLGPTGPSPIQVGAAWGTLGLGTVLLVVGIVFGVDASGTEDDVRNGELREGDVYVATQREAQNQLDEAADKALLANVFLGTGVALLGVSALLFLITPGSDIDTQADTLTSGSFDLQSVTPTVTSEGWGVSSSWTF